jgi:hypothetical protein
LVWPNVSGITVKILNGAATTIDKFLGLQTQPKYEISCKTPKNGAIAEGFFRYFNYPPTKAPTS